MSDTETEIEAMERIEREWLLKGKSRTYIENHYKNVLRPRGACNQAIDFYNPGYEADYIIEGKVKWEWGIVIKDILGPIFRYLTNEDVRKVKGLDYSHGIRWRFFGRTLEDIYFTPTRTFFDDNNEFWSETISVTCSVSKKSSLKHRILLDVNMNYFSECMVDYDGKDFWYVVSSEGNRLEIGDDRKYFWADNDYLWNGKSHFEYYAKDGYTSLARRKSCGKD